MTILATAPYKSYRYRGRFGWIYIGAHDRADALKQARRSTDEALTVDRLFIWAGSNWIREAMTTYFVEPANDRGLDRRVFRRIGSADLFGWEWSHYSEWERDSTRCRWYGYSPALLPVDVKEITR